MNFVGQIQSIALDKSLNYNVTQYYFYENGIILT
jgi:hypothetical protein